MKIIILAQPKDDHAASPPGLKKAQNQKEKFMSSNNNHRVLTRKGARQLNGKELEKVGGGDHITLLSAILTGSPNGQGHDLRSDT